MTAIATGMRVKCAQENCGAEIIVTRAGSDELWCHGQAMEATKPPASSGTIKFQPFELVKDKCNECQEDAVFRVDNAPYFCSPEHSLQAVVENKERINQLGKRYRCYQSGAEMLCLKPGKDARVDCIHNAVWLVKPKVLPSAD